MTGLKLITLIFATCAAMAWAQDTKITPALTFQDWKENQLLEAQNQVLRANAKISQLKNKKASVEDKKDSSTMAGTTNARVKKLSDSDALAGAEKDLRRAQESLEATNALTVNDYITIYLPTLQNQPEAVNGLVEKLSKEELTELFKGLVVKPVKADDAKRNTKSSLLSGVSLTSNSKTP